ncbi:MAG: hypothetical protein ACK5KT_16700 [Dysgonomonas sp.]
MKTKFKYLALVATALLLGFSNCSNDDETDGNSGNSTPKSVYLKIGNEPTTYAEGSPVANATTVGFSSGDLYFVNGSGAILQHYTLSTAATSATNINLAAIQAGELISNLPGSVSAVHVVGNTPALPTSGNISAVKAAALQVTSQGAIATVNLYGTNTLTLVSGNQYTSAITLKPTVARIELTDITASGVVTGFQVDGIFVDNYYSQAAADGSVLPANLVSNGPSTTAFDDATTEYPATLKPTIYDWNASGLGTLTGLVCAPTTAGNVWGYNLFATSTGSAVPRIIIRLSNITTSDGSTIAGTQYITIKGFSETGTPLTGIEAGKVYNIGAGNFTFTESDLTITPNLTTIDVTVTVTLATWSVVNITPDI